MQIVQVVLESPPVVSAFYSNFVLRNKEAKLPPQDAFGAKK